MKQEKIAAFGKGLASKLNDAVLNEIKATSLASWKFLPKFSTADPSGDMTIILSAKSRGYYEHQVQVDVVDGAFKVATTYVELRDREGDTSDGIVFETKNWAEAIPLLVKDQWDAGSFADSYD